MKIQFLISLLLLSTGVKSFACEYHGGFGFGSFGQLHPLAQQHILASERTKLEIIHNEVLHITDSQGTLTIKYVVPQRYANTELTLSSSESLFISNSSPLSLTKAEGELTIPFHVTHSGQHDILVRIDAKQNYRPFSKIQRIKIISD
jgi:hypothetical protein